MQIRILFLLCRLWKLSNDDFHVTSTDPFSFTSSFFVKILVWWSIVNLIMFPNYHNFSEAAIYPADRRKKCNFMFSPYLTRQKNRTFSLPKLVKKETGAICCWNSVFWRMTFEEREKIVWKLEVLMTNEGKTLLASIPRSLKPLALNPRAIKLHSNAIRSDWNNSNPDFFLSFPYIYCHR